MILAFTASVFLSVAHSQDKQTQPQAPAISLEELRHRTVVGKLGVPLGQVVEIQATIVAGSELRSKAHVSQYFLQVTHVERKKLKKAPLLEFSSPRIFGVKIASNHNDLVKMKTGKVSGGISSEKINKLEKGYIGKSLRLVAYESGCFSGIPNHISDTAREGLSKSFPWWQDRGFGFSTSLTVLAEKSMQPENAKQPKGK